MLLAASLFFYAWGAPRFVLVLVGATWVDWMISRAIAAAPPGSARRRRWLVGSLVLNLGLLGWFKYANFAAGQVRQLGSAMGFELGPWVEIALPLGISFFTFHKISYVVDVYRGVAPPAPSFGLLSPLHRLFPQLIAGPIVRYRDVDRQLARARDHTVDRLPVRGLPLLPRAGQEGARRERARRDGGQGLRRCRPRASTPAVAWVGVARLHASRSTSTSPATPTWRSASGACSGSSSSRTSTDPYLSRSFTEFWRRWHISLSTWFMRDYLFIPLGGNRRGAVRGYVNLWIVFLLSGLWHGAAWTFVVWGAYHGLFLSLDRLFWGRVVERLPRFVGVGHHLPAPQHRVGLLPVRRTSGTRSRSCRTSSSRARPPREPRRC